MKTITFDPVNSGVDEERVRVDIIRKMNGVNIQTAWDRHVARLIAENKRRKLYLKLYYVLVVLGSLALGWMGWVMK